MICRMSWCECENSTHYRITGEVWHEENKDGETFDTKYARIRCAECTGKVGVVPAKFLEKFEIDREDIKNGGGIEPVTVEIDLL